MASKTYCHSPTQPQHELGVTQLWVGTHPTTHHKLVRHFQSTQEEKTEEKKDKDEELEDENDNEDNQENAIEGEIRKENEWIAKRNVYEDDGRQ